MYLNDCILFSSVQQVSTEGRGFDNNAVQLVYDFMIQKPISLLFKNHLSLKRILMAAWKKL